jgi:hypothetical protein
MKLPSYKVIQKRNPSFIHQRYADQNSSLTHNLSNVRFDVKRENQSEVTAPSFHGACMHISPSQANIRPAGQEIPRLLQKRNLHYRVQKSLPLVKQCFKQHYLSIQRQEFLKKIVQKSGVDK